MISRPGPSLAERLSMEPGDLEIVTGTLTRVVPGRAVWAFGSRARGRQVKRFSDLDLAVEGALGWTERAELTEAFDESLLPMKVDVLELGLTAEDFRARVSVDFVLVQAASKG